MKNLLQFGAGNIGRSFIGQLFSRADYEVVFVDVDQTLISAFNARHSYTVEIRDQENQTIEVKNVRAISAVDVDSVVREIASASIMGTAVGPAVLPRLFPVLARGIQERHAAGAGPIDIILCENLRNAAETVRSGLQPLLPGDFPLAAYMGLVETSIGKMVPMMPDEVRKHDPLMVFAEAYNTLILDHKGFINEVPDVPGLAPKDNMKAYVDRKSFIHNLGHAALAYYAHLVAPEMTYTYQAVEDPELRAWVKIAMWESGRTLMAMYPGEFTQEGLEEHIEDLLQRFGNKVLGDTIHRVGRDLRRKLSAIDRVAGPLIEAERGGLPAPYTAIALAAGLYFLAPGSDNKPFQPDAEIVRICEEQGPEQVIREICGQSDRMIRIVTEIYRSIGREQQNGRLPRQSFGALGDRIASFFLPGAL
ncbi:MAG: hypothetical protein A2268_07175 [Candidatus Raymondbacteria bacterium RifOxyA12_full_50_37]|uniref:Mannitol-1-phosphate 5-dehydrogenase n=1 Tax=Candidatus Raymondbacteria bacterium RIFOXYD12_FULL_49_13 TaxID=1817890 RepID=A0A1F7FED5_UNCRA|nr:MAG: hypothetical protein A2350_11115 [Candidatus Raymondbacteria bacterium RifOxyB12_full_50_8]OGJ89756.1 MAG: hypothetical protein A2268_07175 [Candidatus Raymondbacteria bacterium RifOxyA12_full_50_37]OGJ96299.1 MAG: hypothetical protein A2487_00530 [Candidatus Raymondbacteria bacterium RifOxyC12_full_50_8]OGJ97562.1 MAG: hypothetical protein A2453_02085 [Candidatus Raymondbacteria bacterium RIFOXYC2_FULL_50_21]OGK05035.1 MAG: hypothetical protein A2519_10205 [Candidatus Raymondbacteria b